MNLDDTLKLIALQLHLDPNELIRFASEDFVGGYHRDPALSKWHIGSLYEVEGKALYALVRALKPQHVGEIGSLYGCSTTHLATALSVNGEGRLTAVDIEEKPGSAMPPHLSPLVTKVIGDGLEWLRSQPDASIDLIFEDSSHGSEMCYQVAELCKTKLAPGGVLVMHDAAHTQAFLGDGTIVHSPVGAEVCAGLDRALGTEYRVYLSEPSDCGFAVAVQNMKVKPGAKYYAAEAIKDQLAKNPFHIKETDSSPVDSSVGERLRDGYVVDAPPESKPTVVKGKGGRPRKAK
jgi:hypothetical protein